MAKLNLVYKLGWWLNYCIFEDLIYVHSFCDHSKALDIDFMEILSLTIVQKYKLLFAEYQQIFMICFCICQDAFVTNQKRDLYRI